MAGKVVTLSNLEPISLPQRSFLVDELGYLVGFQHKNGKITILPAARSQDNITAFAAGGQDNATPLSYANCRITTSAGASASCVMPQGILGMRMFIQNASGNNFDLFPATGDAFGTSAVNAALSVITGQRLQLTFLAPGIWSKT